MSGPDWQEKAARAARREIGRLRNSLVESHSVGATGRRRDIERDDPVWPYLKRLDQLYAELGVLAMILKRPRQVR